MYRTIHHHQSVLYSVSSIRVDRGVVQGDPMSAALFAMVISKVLKGVCEKGLASPAGSAQRGGDGSAARGDGVVVGAYADDVTLAAGTVEEAANVMGELTTSLAGMGLTV